MSAESRRSVIYSQNFIRSRKVARRLVSRSSISGSDTVVEVGPGRGMLTVPLARQSGHVIAVEKDPVLAGNLITRLDNVSNVTVFPGDFLSLPLPLTPYKVVANIPFNITADLVRKFTRAENPPDDMFIVVQKEAADRFIGMPEATMFSILLYPWFEVTIDYAFRSTDFVPEPRVRIVLLRFSKRGPPLVLPEHARSFRDFVTFGFTAWQPDICRALTPVFGREAFIRLAREFGIDPGCRPRLVTAEQWLLLHNELVADPRFGAGRARVAGAENQLHQQQSRLERPRRTRTSRRRR